MSAEWLMALPSWTAQRPNASQPLGGYGRLASPWGAPIAVARASAAIGNYNHNAIFDYLVGEGFFIAWKNGKLHEDSDGQRVLGSLSRDALNWSAVPLVVFPNLTTADAAAVLEPAPTLHLNSRRYAAASPSFVNTTLIPPGSSGWRHTQRGAQCALWPDSLEPRNCGPAVENVPIYERTLLLRRVHANGALGPLFWASSRAPELFAAASARLGIVTVERMDATTRRDIASLVRAGAPGAKPPCDASQEGSLKCEWCPGGCPLYASIPTGLGIANERAYYRAPHSQAEFVLFRADSPLGVLYASARRGSSSAKDWGPIFETDIPNDDSNIDAGLLPNGSVFLASNPLIGRAGFRQRDPITLAVSDDGSHFRTVGVAMTCEDLGVDACHPRTRTSGNGGPSYPQVVVVSAPAPRALHGVYVSATNNKEDVWVTRLHSS